MTKQTLIALEKDPHEVREITAAATPWYSVMHTPEPKLALAWLKVIPTVAVITVNEILSSQGGMDLLKEAQTLRPQARRILLSDYADLPTVMAALHSGAVQHVASKPVRKAELAQAISPDNAAIRRSAG